MKKILLFFIVLLSIFGLRGYAQIGYKFTGSQNHIVTSGDLSNYISNRNALTVEFWARPSVNSNLMFTSIYVPGSAGQTELGGFGLYQNTLIVSIGSDFAGFSQSVDLGNRLSTVGWHHFAYVYNGAEWFFYLDGALISSNPDQEGLSGATPNYSGSGLTQFKIGGLSDGSTVIGALDYFDGSMDDFRVWNTARTQTQISSNRTIELTGSETGLILYYKLNEQSGQVVSNSTALSLNGVRGVTSGTETRDPAINQLGIVTGPPVTTTTAATNIAGSGATLNGTVHDNGANTTVSFDYSTNATLGSGVITVNATTGGTVNVGSGNTAASVALSGLTGSTTYYYRVKASNSGGSTIGNILSFTTAASTASPVVIVPANGSFVSTTTPTYGGTAPAGSTIRVYVDGTVLGNTTTANSAGNWAITQPTALAQGSHTVYATAQSSGNAVSANSPTNTFTVDSLRPSLVISSTAGPSGATTGTSPIPFTVIFSESVTGFVAGDLTPGNATISGFSGSGTTYTFNATPTANGAVTMNIPANVAQDAAGNGNTAASPFSITYTQMATASPVVIVPANGGFVSTPTPTYGGTAPAGSTITVYVDGTALGTTTANSAGNWAITQPTALAQGSHTVYATAQSSGNAVSANSPTNTFTVDSLRPSLVISSTAGASGGSTGSSPIPFTVTFSESVTGFVAGDLTPGNATISGFSGSGTTYTFNATPIANGAVTMNIAANVAQDAAGNGSTAGSQFSINYILQAPIVTTSGGSTAFTGSAIAIDNGLTVTDADNTTLSYASVTITANFIAGEDILAFINNSSALYGNITGSYNAGTGVLTLTSSGATATIAQWQEALRAVGYGNAASSPNTATRTISFTVNDGTANSTIATKNVTVINQATVISIVRAASNPTNAAAVTYTVTFNKSVTGISTTNFSITTSGTINGISPSISGSGTTYTVTINTGTGSGTIRLNLANSNGISPSTITTLPFIGETYNVDKIAPSVTSVAVPANATYTASENLDFTVNFSEAVTVDTTVNTPFIAVTLSTGGTVRANYISGSGTNALLYRYTVASTDRDFDGIVLGALNINGATIRDAASNNANTTLNNVDSTAGVLVDGTPNTSQTITFNTLPVKTYGDADFDPGATSNNSGIPITYASSNTNVATIVHGKIHVIAVGSSTITASQAGDGSHNAATDVQQTLTVNAKSITVTADPKSKTYGDADPALTYTFAPALVGGDSFSGSLTRTAGENVGTYAINQGTLALNSNYIVTYVGADFTIGAKPITVTADPKSKTYGEADPALTYTFAPALVAGDSFSGSLTRTAGENVGTYAINQGTLALNSNYTVTYVGADFTIGAKPITVTADPKSKTYGDADPALTYNFAPALVGGDGFSGSLTRTAGENVGTYAIHQGTLALNSNYTVTYVGADFTIGAKPITLTADAKSKTYGDADPALTYTFAPALVGGDSFSGSLNRTAGENVGTYAINQGTLALNSNYTVTYVGADLTIGAKPIAVTADAKSKTYGDADPALTYTFAPELVAGDSFSGSLTRTAGENVGTYAISQGTLALNSNYTVNYVAADFTIGAKPITVAADAKSKTYGDADPALTYTFAPALIAGDSFSGSLTRTAGENVGTYAISQGTLVLSSNYTVTYVGADFTIGAKAITVRADAKSKTYGDADPALTYTFAPALVDGDSFSGSLNRTAGENVGTYAIHQGTLALNSNYTVNYMGADFTIGAKPITVTADAKSKTYGDADPALTYTFTPALVGGDGFSGRLTRTAGENVGTYAINQGTLALNSNYTLSYVGADLKIGAKPIVVTADAKSKTYGDADPALTYTFTPALVAGDSFSGSLTRTAGENVGTYAINQGTLALNSNYTLSYVGADLKIGAKPIVVTADAKSKTYGDADPALTYTFTPALVAGDSFSGSLTRTAGENVGTYTITQGTLSAGTNYTVSFIENDFIIVKANQTITWNQTLAFGCEGESTVILTATSSSNLPVSYTSSNSSLASISGNVLNVENYGSVNILATQPGNNNYNAAASVSLPLVRSQPNLIRQQFENVIFFDNSSKSFSSYTWYKNGILITGQTNQYYKEDGPLNGTYHAVAIRLDGTSVTTCPIVLSPTMEQQYIKIVPNPVKPNASYELLNNVPASLLQNARVQVYNITGQLMEDKTISQKTETLQAPNVEGIYIVRMTLTNGKYFSKNLLVKN